MRENIAKKLWVMWAVLGLTAFVAGGLTGSFPLALGIAIASATCGWAAFLIGD